MDKKPLRKEIAARIAAMSATQKSAESQKVAQKVASFGITGKKVFIYNALPDEVDTGKLIKTLAADNDVYLPVVDGEDMFLVKYGGKTVKGAFGISEPEGERLTAEDVAPDICVTPLRAFDGELNRLGRGKGYYDRFFAACDCEKIALAFDCQKTDKINADAHDVKMDVVVTASETYRK